MRAVQKIEVLFCAEDARQGYQAGISTSACRQDEQRSSAFSLASPCFWEEGRTTALLC